MISCLKRCYIAAATFQVQTSRTSVLMIAQCMAQRRAPLAGIFETPETVIPHNAAEATGVEGNGAADGAAFIRALIVNIVVVLVFMCVFMNPRHKYPWQYQNNITIGEAPTACLGGTKEEVQENLSATWGWYQASMGTTTDEVADTRGLDMAKLVCV